MESIKTEFAKVYHKDDAALVAKNCPHIDGELGRSIILFNSRFKGESKATVGSAYLYDDGEICGRDGFRLHLDKHFTHFLVVNDDSFPEPQNTNTHIIANMREKIAELESEIAKMEEQA